MSLPMVLSIAVFCFTLLLVLVRPFRLNVGVAALFGAGLTIILRLVTWADVLAVTHIVWNATAALVGIMLISAALDKAGFFEWTALVLCRKVGGSGTRLFVAVILLSAAVSTLFTNDGTVLILTPIVYAMVSRLQFAPGAIVAFLFATGFVADTVSTPLVVSNLVNIMSADYFGLSFTRYALLMFFPSVVSLLVSLLALYILYRKHLPGHFTASALPVPESVVPDKTFFKLSWAVVLFLVPIFMVGAAWHVPISLQVGVAAVLLLIVGQRRRVFRAADLLRTAPWHVIAFALGMYVVVYALRNAGLVTALANWLVAVTDGSLSKAIFATGSVAAGLSSTMNNLPATMTGLLTIDAMSTPAPWQSALALANVIGCDLGPKMTPIGSLATLLWLHELEKRQVHIDWRYYLKVGLLLTPPVLFATLGALALIAGWF